MGLELLVSWYLDWCLNHYSKLALISLLACITIKSSKIVYKGEILNLECISFFSLDYHSIVCLSAYLLFIYLLLSVCLSAYLLLSIYLLSLSHTGKLKEEKMRSIFILQSAHNVKVRIRSVITHKHLIFQTFQRWFILTLQLHYGCVHLTEHWWIVSQSLPLQSNLYPIHASVRHIQTLVLSINVLHHSEFFKKYLFIAHLSAPMSLQCLIKLGKKTLEYKKLNPGIKK